MNNLLKFMKNKKLSFENMKVYKTNTCWDCGKQINPKSCWQKLQEINGEVMRVNICDNCSGKSIAFEGENEKYYYGWYIKELISKLNDNDHIDYDLKIKDFVKQCG